MKCLPVGIYLPTWKDVIKFAGLFKIVSEVGPLPLHCRTKKWPFPDLLPTVGCSEKISPRQGDPTALGRQEHDNPTKQQDKHLGLENGRGQTHGETPCELFFERQSY